jgi:CheY-like chemotaxis protein
MLINGDPSQLEQVVLNLGTNARDAMPEGGALRVATRRTELDPERAHTLGIGPGGCIVLEVSDDGLGIDDDTMPHLFEPFFTTKEVGEGTGLGLSTVYGIVASHGGHTECSSTPGQGTTFSAYFPALDGSPGAAVTTAEAAEYGAGGNETILVVDDEQSILEIAQETLRHFGYRTLIASSGERALELYRQRDDIDLVVLDVGMPGMGGLRCLDELRTLDPSVRVLVASGYTEDANISDLRSRGACDFIGKPYQLPDLLAKVRSVLDTAV